MYSHLFSPLTIRSTELRNRIFSTGHQTNMASDGRPTERMARYHEARAAGGAALIVTEAARMHETAFNEGAVIDVSTDACIDGFARMASLVQGHGAKIFGQLSHPGRVNARTLDGVTAPSYSASNVRDERFKNIPRALSVSQIDDIVEAHALAAVRMRTAGLDGVEVSSAFGVLGAQFLNPATNHRDDDYGGSLENRVRFLVRVFEAMREAVGPDMVIGVRLAIDEKEENGLGPQDTIDAAALLDQVEALDYYNLIGGSMAGRSGGIHVVPPMLVDTAYLASDAARFRASVTKPVFLAGRINQPQIAEQVLANGEADMCGMTRAMIADPQMANKAKGGRSDDIRACIACNQACIGHFHTGAPISCIQHPETGREERFATRPPAHKRRRIVVAGGGPAGMKAAAVAAERGHDVTLYEAAPHLGGQVRLAQTIPGRAEFGGLITNLERELALAGVSIETGQPVTAELIDSLKPDAVVIATGAHPHLPGGDTIDGAHVVEACAVLADEANVGTRVVIADWRGDWIGMGVAEKLARAGCHVRLAVLDPAVGMGLQIYLRDQWAGTLHGLGVEVVPFMRFFGADGDSAYFSHAVSREPVTFDDVDTVVMAHGHDADTDLEEQLGGFAGEICVIGDCLSPRTAEEAVYEGLLVGTRL
jgi:2,4-dienoyl-CoA reductase-like NADH-dependent reductase (Old Yellow Enzyme family)